LHPQVRPGAVVVVARDVHVDYAGVHALAGADLELRAGEVQALIGPNGSGKTTLLRVLSGARRPDRGLVLIDGRPARVVPPEPCTTASYARLRRPFCGGAEAATAGRGRCRRRRRREFWRPAHLLATPSAGPVARRRVGRAAAALDSSSFRPTAVGSSRGEQRCCSRAGRGDRGQGLLLDEPAAGMARAERDQLAAALRRLAAHGAAVCVVEHDMRFVAAVADRVTVLDRGRVLMSGSPAAVRNDARVRDVYLGVVETG